MSFNNPLAFSLSKSSATTGTTNTSTVHVTSSGLGVEKSSSPEFSGHGIPGGKDLIGLFHKYDPRKDDKNGKSDGDDVNNDKNESDENDKLDENATEKPHNTNEAIIESSGEPSDNDGMSNGHSEKSHSEVLAESEKLEQANPDIPTETPKAEIPKAETPKAIETATSNVDSTLESVSNSGENTTHAVAPSTTGNEDIKDPKGTESGNDRKENIDESAKDSENESGKTNHESNSSEPGNSNIKSSKSKSASAEGSHTPPPGIISVPPKSPEGMTIQPYDPFATLEQFPVLRPQKGRSEETKSETQDKPGSSDNASKKGQSPTSTSDSGPVFLSGFSDLTTSEVTSVEEIHATSDNSDEKHRESHKPFDFPNFLAHLRKKSADPIVRYIRSFLVSFCRQAHTFTQEQKIKVVRDFKAYMTDKFLLYAPFSNMDEIDLENSREGLEKLIMNRIYEYCFPPEVEAQSPACLSQTCKEVLAADRVFVEQLDKFSWINGSHLDIDLLSLETDMVDYATAELNKINNYRAPRDKIICVLNCCKIIFSYLKVSKKETNADAFVPLLILILLKAKTPHLVSNVHYIESYRGEEWLLYGETAYYLSSLQGAINFINTVTADSLTIGVDEFNAHIEAWEASQHQSRKTELLQPQPQQSSDARPVTPSMSPSNVLFTSAELISKSISNLLSSSPGEAETRSSTRRNSSMRRNSQTNSRRSSQTEGQMRRSSQAGAQTRSNSQTESQADTTTTAEYKETLANLKEMFPSLDEGLLKDVIVMNKGKMEASLDACLQLMDH